MRDVAGSMGLDELCPLHLQTLLVFASLSTVKEHRVRCGFFAEHCSRIYAKFSVDVAGALKSSAHLKCLRSFRIMRHFVSAPFYCTNITLQEKWKGGT